MSRRSSWSFLALLLLLGGCPQFPQISFVVPFRYRGLGVGPSDTPGMILLARQGTEESLLSRAIVGALQKMDLSIVPALGPLDVLPVGKPWQTDIVPLPPALVEAYNARARERNSALVLPPYAVYGLQFKGRYDIKGREFGFVLSPTLYHRGLASPFTPYRREYSGEFFAERTKAEIITGLKTLTAEQPPEGGSN